MQTRSRKLSEAVGDVTGVTQKATPLKNTKRLRTTSTDGTPSKTQKADALVENILNAASSQNGNQLKGNEKSSASDKIKSPKIATKPVTKVIRGQPKSGRPWKDVKQK